MNMSRRSCISLSISTVMNGARTQKRVGQWNVWILLPISSQLSRESTCCLTKPQQAKIIYMVCIYDSDSSIVARTRLASVVTLASARMTPCEYSTPNTALMLVAIRFACFSDQKRKSSAEGWESVLLMLSTSRLLGSNADAGRRDGSASRHRLMM